MVQELRRFQASASETRRLEADLNARNGELRRLNEKIDEKNQVGREQDRRHACIGKLRMAIWSWQQLEELRQLRDRKAKEAKDLQKENQTLKVTHASPYTVSAPLLDYVSAPWFCHLSVSSCCGRPLTPRKRRTRVVLTRSRAS